MDIGEARLVLLERAKEVFERDQLRPNGLQAEFYVRDDRHPDGGSLPNIGITLYANGTWEYTDKRLRDNDD